MKVLVSFLRVKADTRTSTPRTLFFQNSSDQNFEIAVLFEIVQQ